MITSKFNPAVKELRLLKQAKHRQARREFSVEGVRLVEEAFFSGQAVRRIVHSPRLEKTSRGAALLAAAREKFSSAGFLAVSDEVLGSLSDTQAHQGILAVLGTKDFDWKDLRGRGGPVLILHELQDPGNLGTIFRIAEAGSAAGLVLTPGTADPCNPKTVRASMGSLFRLPFLTGRDPRGSMQTLRSLGYRILATAVEGGTSLWETDFTGPWAVIFGQEGAGLPAELSEGADGFLTIPMSPAVNSLNVALSAGLVVYEALRQKKVRSHSARSSEQKRFSLDIAPDSK